MSDPRAKTYRPWNPDAYRQQTHSPDAKLPEDDLVFFLLDLVPQLDLTAITAPYEQELRGAPPFDPALMTCLLLYAYGVGVYSSRKIARACERMDQASGVALWGHTAGHGNVLASTHQGRRRHPHPVPSRHRHRADNSR